jgi:hypothetical protein
LQEDAGALLVKLNLKAALTHLSPRFASVPLPTRSSWIFTPLGVLMNLAVINMNTH